MQIGDVFNIGLITVAVGDYFNIRPPSMGIECIIHNINLQGGDVLNLEFYDGSNFVTAESMGISGTHECCYHCTFDKYYRLQNTGTTEMFAACDGVITKIENTIQIQAGDVFSKVVTLASGEHYNLCPIYADNAVIHNIYTSVTANVEFYDGTNAITVMQISSGGWHNIFLHCTNYKYYRIRAGGQTNIVGFDGIYTSDSNNIN